MAASAAIAIVSAIGGAVVNNQASQRQKGAISALNAKVPDPTESPPTSAAAAAQAGIAAGAAAAGQQRRRAIGAYGMNETILTSPRGGGQPPLVRKTLLGL